MELEQAEVKGHTSSGDRQAALKEEQQKAQQMRAQQAQNNPEAETKGSYGKKESVVVGAQSGATAGGSQESADYNHKGSRGSVWDTDDGVTFVKSTTAGDFR